MTVMALEEFREIASEQDLLEMLRDDAFLIWGPHTIPLHPIRESERKGKGCLSALAVCFRGVLSSLHKERRKIEKESKVDRTRR